MSLEKRLIELEPDPSKGAKVQMLREELDQLLNATYTTVSHRQLGHATSARNANTFSKAAALTGKLEVR